MLATFWALVLNWVCKYASVIEQLSLGRSGQVVVHIGLGHYCTLFYRKDET